MYLLNFESQCWSPGYATKPLEIKKTKTKTKTKTKQNKKQKEALHKYMPW